MAINESKNENELLQEAMVALQTSISQLRMAEELIQQQGREIESLRAELEAERLRFNGYFESSTDGLIVTTFDGLILEANREAAALLSAAPADLIRRPLVLYVAEEERSAFCSRLKSLYAIPSRLELKFRVQPLEGQAFSATLRVGTVYRADKTPKALRWTISKAAGADLKASEARPRIPHLGLVPSGH
ncbi:MAG: PAS domain-containing protein [Armatimonadetes bacterium]|nr:PAS domain-containing protein [Armatimonadota bacterium]